MKVRQAEFVLSAVRGRDLVADGRPQFAFVGRSNVGKSSLLNRLVGRRALARISAHPGKTRAVNYFLIEGAFYFVDLPGYGYAKAAKTDRQAWAELMDRYLRATDPQPRIIQLVDAKVGATALDVQATDYLRHLDREPLIVATKIDRVARNQQSRQLATIRTCLGLEEANSPIPCSARSGEGIKDVWKAIDASLRPVAEMAN